MKFPFLKSPERYLVLETLSDRTHGLLLRVTGEKKIIPERAWDDFSWGRMSKFIKKLRGAKMIVSADPSRATTIMIPAEMKRDPKDAAEPLGPVELENLLAQETARVFTQVREQASRELGLDELHTIVVENRAGNFRVDGHKVLNPLGFAAKRIEAILELTLTTREVFDEWKHLFAQSEDFFFTETARAELYTIRKVHQLPVNLLKLEPDKTSFFILDRAAAGTAMYRGRLDWSLRSLMKCIEDAWGVSPDTAERVYRKYLKKEVSPHVARFLEKTLKPSLEALLKAAGKSRLKGAVFIESPLPLPFVYPYRRGGITYSEPSVGDILAKVGLSINARDWGIPHHELVSRLAPFLEFYYNKTDSVINRWLKRRIHWLGGST